MAVNKVDYYGRTLIDISDSTVTPETLAADAVAYNAAGERIVGIGEIQEPTNLPAKNTLQNMSWSEIQTICKAGAAAEYWNIGDQKNISFGGVTYPVCLIGFDHDTPADAASYGRGKAGATFQLYNPLTTTHRMNDQTTGNGWGDSVMRLTFIPTILNGLDSELVGVIVPVLKTYAKQYQLGTLATIEDEIFLLSNEEVFGNKGLGFAGEGTQYAYYSAGNSKIKYSNGAAVSWWLRSLRNGYNTQFCYVTTIGDAHAYTVSTSLYVAFAFCV